MDCSIATFYGVHTGLAAGSIYLCGDEEQTLDVYERDVLPEFLKAKKS